MKYIDKGPEPAALADWKNRINDPENAGWTLQWGNFQNPYKAQTHLSLLNDQGNLCCYCMREITEKNSHIEHIKPRSMSTEEEKLDYGNMLASCQGEDNRQKTVQNHCGHYRGNWYDSVSFVTPLNPHCEERFRFFEDGSIECAPGDAGAGETIKHLRLDYTLLAKRRKAVIQGIIGDGTDMPSETELQRLIARYSSRNEFGGFLPFCVAVVQVLRMYSAQG